MTEKDIYSYWKKAYPLSRAFYRFASPQMKAKYDQLLEEGTPHTRFQKFAPYMKDHAGRSLGELIEVFREDHPIESVYELSELAERMRRNTLGWIRKGELKAYGFATPRKPDAQPVEIPPDLWDCKVSWDNNYVEGQGLRIEAIRVLPPQWMQGTEKRQGRPSRQDEIQSAYADLVKNQMIDFNGSLNSASKKVREHVITLNPNHPDGTKGIGIRAISMIITEDFHLEKTTRKKE